MIRASCAQLFGHTDLVATDVVTAMLMAAEWQREQRAKVLRSIFGEGPEAAESDEDEDDFDDLKEDDESGPELSKTPNSGAPCGCWACGGSGLLTQRLHAGLGDRLGSSCKGPLEAPPSVRVTEPSSRWGSRAQALQDPWAPEFDTHTLEA